MIIHITEIQKGDIVRDFGTSPSVLASRIPMGSPYATEIMEVTASACYYKPPELKGVTIAWATFGYHPSLWVRVDRITAYANPESAAKLRALLESLVS